MKTVKIVLMPLLLASIIALFSITGCAGTGTTPQITTPSAAATQEELNQQELEEILYASMTNEANLDTYTFIMDMDINTDVIGEESVKMIVSTKSNGAADLASGQMHMRMEMEMSAEGIGYEAGTQSLAYDVYQITDWIYMKMEVSGMGEQWMKIRASEEMNEKLNLVDQQLEPLGSAIELKLLGYADVDGEECYVISIVPDIGKITQWLSEQQGAAIQDIDWADIPNLSDVFKNLEYTYYVTKNSRLPKKLVLNMQMEMTPLQLGEFNANYDKMIMNISLDMTLSDFNEPSSITLPDEAQDATEVSEDMFQ